MQKERKFAEFLLLLYNRINYINLKITGTSKICISKDTLQNPKLEYSRNITGYSITNLGHTYVSLIWNMGIFQKIFRTYPFSLFRDIVEYWNIPFLIWDIVISENLGYYPFWNIPKKTAGTYKNGEKVEYPVFWNIPGYSISQFWDIGGGA